MKRFQVALKKHLVKQLERTDLEAKELREVLRKRRSEREEVGVTLYGAQQELARQQQRLEAQQEQRASLAARRRHEEEELEATRGLHKARLDAVNQQRKQVASVRAEVERVALAVLYAQEAERDVSGDVAVLKRAAQKADLEKYQTEEIKMKQDMHVERLTRQADATQERIAMLEAQLSAQAQDTQAARAGAAEARAEIDAIVLEKRQLLQHWNATLQGLRRRDEAHANMQEALAECRREALSADTELSNYKRLIRKEEERHGALTVVLHRADAEVAGVRRLTAQCQEQQEALRTDYATYARTLQETEVALARAVNERGARESELTVLRSRWEREHAARSALEDAIMEALREQLTRDKAALYSKKLVDKMRARKKELELDVARAENELARAALAVTQAGAREASRARTLAAAEEETRAQEALVARAETEAARRTALIARKQALVDLNNKKVEQLVASAGGVELGPLELHIKELRRQLAERRAQSTELQAQWLRAQGELVRESREREELARTVAALRQRLTILLQRKLRVEGEVAQQQRGVRDTERRTAALHHSLERLCSLLERERSMRSGLQAGRALLEGEVVGALREAERDAVRLAERLQELRDDKGRLLSALLQAEEQILLWERRTQLAKEMRAAVDADVGHGEMKAMRAEIHRMQVRYTQLLKQQERLMRDMEASVSRRDTITTRAQVAGAHGDRSSSATAAATTAVALQRVLQALRTGIKDVQTRVAQSDGEIAELREACVALEEELSSRRRRLVEQRGALEQLEEEAHDLAERKRKNLQDLVALQTRGKHLEAARGGRYRPLCSSAEGVRAETERQEERLHALATALHRLLGERPHLQGPLRPVSLALADRMQRLQQQDEEEEQQQREERGQMLQQ
nr:coiled-coil domain-containing protein 40 isoform X2 [Petromyzon marinus]